MRSNFYLKNNFGFTRNNFKTLTNSDFKKLSDFVQKQDELLLYFMEGGNSEWMSEYEDQSGDFDTAQEFYDSEVFLKSLLQKQKPKRKIIHLCSIVENILDLLKK